MRPLDSASLERFFADGFVRLDDAFSRQQAEVATAIVLDEADVDPEDPSSWSGPVLRLDGSVHPAVTATINTPRLIGAIVQLLGPANWQHRNNGFGTFPIRFPSPVDPGDTGWHIDGSFGDAPHYMVNFASRGRALLLLMLFTDVAAEDAPTRIRIGSHLDVARALRHIGTDVTFVPELHSPAVLDMPVAEATGPAGTVYLCHPFLVHAASWPHTGQGPRVVAQPAIHHPQGESLGGFDYENAPLWPVAQAVCQGRR